MTELQIWLLVVYFALGCVVSGYASAEVCSEPHDDTLSGAFMALILIALSWPIWVCGFAGWLLYRRTHKK